MPDRVAVAFSMDQVRCRLGAFETAWAAPPVSQQRVLVLRCGGAGIQEVAQRLELTPASVREYAKRVMETMRAATGEGDVLALCWLYGYSRALQDSDEQVMRKQRGV